MPALTLLIGKIIVMGIALQTPKPRELPSVEYVRGMAAAASSDLLPHSMLVNYGVFAFPAFEAILADPKSELRELVGVLGALIEVKGPKSRFLTLAVSHMSHEDSAVREIAIGLVREIGTHEEASILIALLSDEAKGVASSAATALVKIGGQREVTAMDVWLRTGTAYRDDRNFLNYVRECRDKLEKRLKENPFPKGTTN